MAVRREELSTSQLPCGIAVMHNVFKMAVVSYTTQLCHERKAAYHQRRNVLGKHVELQKSHQRRSV